MKKELNIRTIVLVLSTFLVGAWRFTNEGFGHAPLVNFTPIGAMALFGGAYFNTTSRAFILPLLTLFFSDVLLMQFRYSNHVSGILYEGWYWTYGAFALMVLVGKYINTKVSIGSVLGGSLIAALLHWLITDFGVWAAGGRNMLTGLPYTKDISGLITCYIAAIPYFKNLLLSNILYSAILFGGFEIAQYKFSILKPIRVNA